MLARLSVRNMLRSLRDYSIYILTLTISFSLIYAYNLICQTPDIMNLSESMKGFSSVNVAMSVLIVFVVGWLINYIIRFMIQRRGREFSVYMLLGIKNRSIYRMFFIENILLCLASLLMAVLLGTLLYQILTLIIMKVFEVDYRPVLRFSLRALGLTAAYAFGMMLFSLISNRRKLRKMSIYDLMCAEKKSELQQVAKKSTGNVVGFIIFGIVGIVGLGFMHYITVHDSKVFYDAKMCTMPNILICILCVIVCIYGCYICISPAIVGVFLSGNRKYKGNRMIICRELAARMNTMRFTLGSLSMLIMLTFLTIQTGMLLKGFLDELYVSRAPFDVMVTSADAEEDFGAITAYLQSREGIRDQFLYNIYDNGAADIGGYMEREIRDSDWGTYMKYGDYVKLRRMLGYPEPVGGDGYIVHCINSVKEMMLKQEDTDIMIDGRTYSCLEINTEGFALDGMNGVYFVFVIPDEAAAGLGVNHTVMAISTIRETTEATSHDIERLLEIPEGDNIHERMSIRGALKADNSTAVIILYFATFYVALILACTVAAIMAVRLLGDFVKHRYHYRILYQLGMSEQRMDGMLLRQMFVHFATPLLLAIPISISLINSLAQIFNSYVSKGMMLGYMAGSLIGFGFIYALYFVLTYLCFVKAVSRS